MNFKKAVLCSSIVLCRVGCHICRDLYFDCGVSPFAASFQVLRCWVACFPLLRGWVSRVRSRVWAQEEAGVRALFFLSVRAGMCQRLKPANWNHLLEMYGHLHGHDIDRDGRTVMYIVADACDPPQLWKPIFIL